MPFANFLPQIIKKLKNQLWKIRTLKIIRNFDKASLTEFPMIRVNGPIAPEWEKPEPAKDICKGDMCPFAIWVYTHTHILGTPRHCPHAETCLKNSRHHLQSATLPKVGPKHWLNIKHISLIALFEWISVTGHTSLKGRKCSRLQGWPPPNWQSRQSAAAWQASYSSVARFLSGRACVRRSLRQLFWAGERANLGPDTLKRSWRSSVKPKSLPPPYAIHCWFYPSDPFLCVSWAKKKEFEIAMCIWHQIAPEVNSSWVMNAGVKRRLDKKSRQGF